MLDKIEYAKELCKLARICYPVKDDLTKRELYLTVAHDNYSTPSSAIIAFNGSPPRLEVYFRIDSRDIILVDNKVIRLTQNYYKAASLHKFLLETFDQLNFLPNRKIP